MGTSASIPAKLDKETARKAAGDKWKSGHEILFDRMAVQGEITRQQYLSQAPLQTIRRDTLFANMVVMPPPDEADGKDQASSGMRRRKTAAHRPNKSEQLQKCQEVRDEESDGNEDSPRDGDDDDAKEEPKAPEAEEDAAKNALAAAVQRAARRKSARDQQRSSLELKIASTMEHHAEQRDLNMSRFVSKLVKHYPTMLEGMDHKHINMRDTKFDVLMQKGWPHNLTVEKSYDGPTLPHPITMDSMYALSTFYFSKVQPGEKKSNKASGMFSRKKKKGAPVHLHPKFVLQVLAEYLQVLRTQPNVVHVSTAVSQCMTVVGDLHGQLRDLEMIFQQNSMPSATNPYIFNGDLVDRGTHSLEICIILFGLAVADPSCVRINRGNHEDYSVCDTYGFTDEIFSKYPEKSGVEIAELFAEVFAFLPIAAVIDESVFVVHGGLGRYTLEELGRVPRHHFKTLQGVPDELWEGESYGDIKHEEWEALMDALWSDPSSEPGIEPNFKRGAGASWGADYTESWLEREGLTEIIRSHECCEHGFQLHHGSRCMTLFSASNYYAGESNWGAYARLSAVMRHRQSIREEQIKSNTMSFRSNVTIHQFVVDTAEVPVKGSGPSVNPGVTARASIERVRLILYEYKSQLQAEFERLDPGKTGRIDLLDWARTMESVIAIKLPWMHLRGEFIGLSAEQGPQGQKLVDYKPFIEELKASFSSAGEAMEVPIPEYIYRNLPELEAVFRLMNQDGTGIVTIREFNEACDYLSIASGTPITDDDKKHLVETLDPDKTGSISFVDFLNSVRYQYMEVPMPVGRNSSIVYGPDGNADVQKPPDGADGEETEEDDDDDDDAGGYDAMAEIAKAEAIGTAKRARPRTLSISIKHRDAAGVIKKADAEVDAQSSEKAAETGEAPPPRRVRSASAVGKLRVSRDGKHSIGSNAVLAQIASRAQTQ